MTDTESAPVLAPSLVARVQGILFRPTAEWAVIEREPATVKGLFTGYAAILAAIGPLASLIGQTVFATGLFRAMSPVGAVAGALAAYVMSLIGVFVLGFLIDALAPSFGGVSNRLNAMKVAVYSSTASWLAGVFNIIPLLAILGIVGLYSLYLLYRGLPGLMKTPEDKSLAYTIVVILAAIVIWMVIGVVTASIIGSFAMAGAVAAGGF
ncbi:Yip1 family protein [Brevundimonas sp. NPDC092305]|uniref:Yip1 family protein n=1 Tax=Brevundimonas sp. NPDC092305 TaxID=3363957 RepID=UPI003801547F